MMKIVLQNYLDRNPFFGGIVWICKTAEKQCMKNIHVFFFLLLIMVVLPVTIVTIVIFFSNRA